MNLYTHDLFSQFADFSYPVITPISPSALLSLPSASISDGEQIVHHLKDEKPKMSKSPPRHRHDGLSPLPMGMDWSVPPRKWDGRDTVWPHDPRSGWSYTTTLPSWIVVSKPGSLDHVVFYRVQVGIQSPEGITSIRSILRQHNDFLYLLKELKQAFPGKYLPPVPAQKFLRMKSEVSILEEQRCSLEDWMEALLRDINISRSVIMATFIELEAAVRTFFDDINQQNFDSNSSLSGMEPSATAYPMHSDRDQNDYGEVSNIELGMERISSQSNVPYPSETLIRYRPFTKQNIFKRIEHLFVRKLDDPRKVGYMGTESEDFPPESSLWDEKLYLPDIEYQKIFGHAKNLSSDSLATDISLASAVTATGVPSVDNHAIHGDDDTHSNIVDAPVTQNILNPTDAIVLLMEERHRLNRILSTLQQRLGTAKADMEDLITRLNQEIAARKFLTTKVKNLEVDLETTTINCRDSMEQAALTEKEKYTEMQWDIEDLRQQCLELKLKLKSEQEERERAEAAKLAIINENKLLLQQLDINRYELRKLHCEYEELELKSKADVRLLVKEVKSLRTYQSELKQEIGCLIKEKLEVERVLQKEQRRTEHNSAANMKLLHECGILRNRLQECSVNFLCEEEDQLTVNASSPSDAIDLLATSDNRIGLLLAEAQLLTEDVENSVENGNESSGSSDRDGGNSSLRKMLTEMFVDNARLRMQINAVIRSSLSSLVKSDDEHDETTLAKSVLIKFLDS